MGESVAVVPAHRSVLVHGGVYSSVIATYLISILGRGQTLIDLRVQGFNQGCWMNIGKIHEELINVTWLL